MQKGMPTEYLVGLIIIALIVLHVLLWFGGSGDIVFSYSYLMFHFYDFILPSSGFRDTTLAMLASAGHYAETMSFSNFCTLLNATAYPLVLIYLLLAAWTVRIVLRSKRYRFNRQFTLSQLAAILVKRSPGVAHILSRYHAFPDQLLNHTDEESAAPLSPQEFAEKHQLITRSRLFRKRRAQKIFRQQINFDSFKNGNLHFKPYEAALAAAFYRVRVHNDRPFAQQLFDKLNLSCLESKDGFPVFAPVMDEVKAVLTGAQEDNERPAFQVWVKGYRSTRTCLYALLDADLSLPPAQFRWLKGLDRPLWMALSSVGRGKKFVEGAGIIAFSQTETWLKTEAHKTPAYQALAATVRAAANGLERELAATGETQCPVFERPKGQVLLHDALARHLILQPEPVNSPEVTADINNTEPKAQSAQATPSASAEPAPFDEF
ncbi:hypothetical protein EYY93_17805 [Hafnia paralvei]|uniref:secretion/conjugation apparatus DotM-related subunit n=1 Tax=Hafnia paralvei TaxID=546367 RepID=UPI001034D717|nr:hypothetical protein [Hafnia paralvei]TBL98044.1 hypothetical protein EYY93_17805 [Hafnia paralvei]